MSQATGLAALTGLLGAVVKKLTDTIAFATNGQWKKFLTQIVVFLVGIGTVAAGAHSAIAGNLSVAGNSLKSLDGAAQVLLGVVTGAGASTILDIHKSIDGSQTSSQPSVIPPVTFTTVQPTGETNV